MTSPPPLPPPGWYPDHYYGVQRWWDGQQWGPYAPAAPPQTEEEAGKVLALVSWLGYFVVGALAALMIRIVERDGNRFARWHAAEALNLQLTVALVAGPLWVFTIAAVFSTLGDSHMHMPWLFFALWPLFFVIGIGTAVTAILGAVRAGQGVWWRCPVAIPFLRRHRSEREQAGLHP